MMIVPRKFIRATTLWGSLAFLAAGSGLGCHHTSTCAPAEGELYEGGHGGWRGGGHGSKNWRDPCADIPKGAIPQPVGTYAREFMFRQASKAEADDFVMYLYEFEENSAQLGPFGRKHLVNIARRLPDAPFNVLIESGADPRLDEERQLAIVTLLAQAGIADPTNRVRVGYPSAEGLYGDEAPAIYGELVSGNSGAREGVGGAGFGGYGGRGGYGGGLGATGGFGAPMYGSGGGFGFGR
ncbi:MAG: hypothetical protein K8T89_02730 [Planctomycetes bacterium]|nr:hypothetical protein [Planctomycetota bacterium]